MDVAALLLELYGRVPPLAVKPSTASTAPTSPSRPRRERIRSRGSWHTTRVQDHHVSELLDAEQIWITGDSAGAFGLEPEPNNTGYGHSEADVAAVSPERGAALLEYLEAVDARTRTMLATLTAADLDRVVDTRWDPPVTLGVRLVSIADDSLQHVGQAAYVRGLLGI